MKTNTTPERIAGGVDQRWSAKEETATAIVNMRVDDTGFGWVNDRGWELALKPNANHTLAAQTEIANNKSRIYVWERHRGSEVYSIFKTQDGELKYYHANTYGMASAVFPHTHPLNTTPRSMPKSDDPDEQYTPFGRFLTIINGKDEMIKFWGREKVMPFGFTSPTPPPTLVGPDPEYFVGQCDEQADPPTSTYPSVREGLIAVSFPSQEVPAGLGLHITDDKTNNYRYRISFISDTGSESPLSTDAQVAWTNNTPSGNRTYAVFIDTLPIGPPGTVARRIYRTKSLGDLRNDAKDQEFYLITQINDNCTLNYLDVVPDDLLTIVAPSTFASTVISTSYRYSANWNNRMWLAGGQGTDTRIIYSEAGLPEQFGEFSYFDVGNRAGGAITQIFPYYDNLIVFREKAIDVIRESGGSFVCTRLSNDVGTTASNTVTNVEGLGLFFLSYDSVYLFSGGTLGGSQITLNRISDQIDTELKRISKSSLAKASAAYSHKEKEWWCYYPVDGNTNNSRSIVFHTVGGVWSFRNSLYLQGQTGPSYHDINDIATLPDGSFVAVANNQIVPNFPVLNTTTVYPGMPIVWSGKRRGMPSTAYTFVEQQFFIAASNEGPKVASEWVSSWENFGDDSRKKRIVSVEVEVLTSGHNEIILSSATDYRSDFTPAGGRPMVVAEQYGTTLEDALYDSIPANKDQFDKAIFTVNQTPWGQQRVSRIRWDVNTGLISWYQFKLASLDLFQVVSYQIEFVSGERRTINVRAGQRKTP